MALIGETLASSTTAGSQSAVAAAKNEDDLNKFLNLLVTQLKNQDPLDPMDATEFTSPGTNLKLIHSIAAKPKTEKPGIIERGLKPHSVDSFWQSMLRESNSDFCFFHLPILSGQKLDRKFFVSLNFSWAALCLLRDSQRPPTKHRGHQCTSCFNV